MVRGALKEVRDGSGSLPEVQDRSEGPPEGTVRVGVPFRWSGTG